MYSSDFEHLFIRYKAEAMPQVSPSGLLFESFGRVTIGVMLNIAGTTGFIT